jgi:hypothetical protein
LVIKTLVSDWTGSGSVFSSLKCWIQIRINECGSEPWEQVTPVPAAVSLLTPAMLDKVGSVTEEEPLDQDLLQELETIFSSLSCLNGSLLSADHYGCRGSNPGVDLAAWRAAFATIGRCAHDTVPSLVLSGLLAAMEQLRVSPPDVEALRFYLVLPLHPVMREPANAKEFHIPFAERLLRLQGPALKVRQKYPQKASNADNIFLLQYLQPVQQSFTCLVYHCFVNCLLTVTVLRIRAPVPFCHLDPGSGMGKKSRSGSGIEQPGS